MATATRILSTASAARLTRLAASYASRLGEEGIDADFVAAATATAATATAARIAANAAGAKEPKTQTYRSYTAAEGFAALVADAFHGTAGTYDKSRLAVKAARKARKDAELVTATLADVAEIVADVAANPTEISCHLLSDSGEIVAAIPRVSCADCARLAAYGTECRKHSR